MQTPWQGVDAPYFQFDTAFHEMFDGGVPNVFRGHATWEMLNIFSDEESPDADFALTNGEYQYNEFGSGKNGNVL